MLLISCLPLFQGVVTLVTSVLSQQYVSQGPVPQRPAAFAGASLVQPARPTVRRPVSRTIQQDATYQSRTQETAPVQQQQAVRQRRPQIARSRISQDDEQQTTQNFARPVISNSKHIQMSLFK